MHWRSYYTKWFLLMLSIIGAVSGCDYLQKPFPTSTPDATLLPGVTVTGFEGAPRNLDWSPDDQQLLITGWYAGEEQIVVLDVTTGAIEKLVALPREMQQNQLRANGVTTDYIGNYFTWTGSTATMSNTTT